MAQFVDYPAPVGMQNMDYVTGFTSKEIEGVFGIEVVFGNGQSAFAEFADEATRDAFKVKLDAEYLLAT